MLRVAIPMYIHITKSRSTQFICKNQEKHPMFQVNLYGNYFTGTEPRTVAPSRLQYKPPQIYGDPVVQEICQQPPQCYKDHYLPEAVVYPAVSK